MMTNEEIIKVVQANIDGELIEYKMHDSDDWYDCPNLHQPAWQFFDRDYRVKHLTLEEFLEFKLTDDSWNRSYHAACNDILDHMKKLQGE